VNILAVGDTAYVIGIAIPALFGLLIVWLKLHKVYDEVKSPNGTKSGQMLYDLKGENLEIKDKMLDIEEKQVTFRQKVDDFMVQDIASHEEFKEMLTDHTHDDNVRFSETNDNLLNIADALDNHIKEFRNSQDKE